MSTSAISACRLRAVRKSFGRNHVLHNVCLDLPTGQVTVLIGANGAGKSTLVKILSGLYARDSGTIELLGRPFAPRTPLDAIHAGIVTVHQFVDDGVVPNLDVASNLVLDEFSNSEMGFFIRVEKIRKRASEIAAIMGLEIPLDTPVSRLGLADRQLITIARAMARAPKVLILDEPTSSLSAVEAERLYSLVDRLRRTGVAVLYITHSMSDVRAVADRIVSMRDGHIVGIFEDTPLDCEAAVAAMLGRQMNKSHITITRPGPPVVEFREIQLFGNSAPINLSCRRNEVVAITGLLGSGKARIAEILFGMRSPVAGRVLLDDLEYCPQDPAAAIAAGVFLCPRDRASNAIVPDFNLIGNLTLPFFSRYCSYGFLNSVKQRSRTRMMIEQLGIVCQSESDSIATLSGGNQQKIIIGRWLSERCRLLVLDEPFQGVDIGARRDIGTFIRASAESRATIVLVSELDEALKVADRIITLSEGEFVGEHANNSIDVDRIMSEVSGQRVAV